MSEATSRPDGEGPDPSTETDSVERIEELTDRWESSPLTDPIAGGDPDARPIIDHGDTPTDDERIAQRPDF